MPYPEKIQGDTPENSEEGTEWYNLTEREAAAGKSPTKNNLPQRKEKILEKEFPEGKLLRSQENKTTIIDVEI